MGKHRLKRGIPPLKTAAPKTLEARGGFVSAIKNYLAVSDQAAAAMNAARQAGLEALVRQEAEAQKITLESWVFNADTGKWQER